MKKYICLNRIDCSWADEVPPREFTLAGNGDEPCPNCEKLNIREVLPPTSSRKKTAIFIAGVVLIAGLLYFIFREPSVITKIDDGRSSTDSSESSTQKANDDNITEEEKEKEKPHKQTIPVTWTQVAGSEFCVGDCIVAYSEIDNLGHTRERRVENYEKCCPADK